MGLEDREALQTLRAVIAPDAGGRDVARRIFARWFVLDPPVRDHFGADMGHQYAVFAEALHWLLGEFVARRSTEPIAFLAQLGRDHRRYGAGPAHHETLRRALCEELRHELASRWDARLHSAADEVARLTAVVMTGSAAADPTPAWWDATVVEHHRVSRDLAVVRLIADRPLPYLPGQYLHVEVPQCPRRWRWLSPAIPADDRGRIEFHVRAVPGGWFASSVVTSTTPGDRWRLSAPHGALEVDRDGADVLMVAGSTGLAPLRAIILDLARHGDNPRVHLFYGARHPCELYDLRTLWQVAAHNPWLSVTPVSEHPFDPPWAAGYPDPEPPRGLHVRQYGRLPEVVSRYGAWGDRQILLAGSPAMVAATREALVARGTPAGRIAHDPLPTT